MPSASRVGVNLRASAYLHQGDRKYMEDEFQVAYQRTHDKKDIEYAFFGIFDGHGGKEAAHFAKDNLMDNIVSLRAFWSDDDEDVLAAIKEGFLQTHMAMWKVLDQWPRTASGWPSTSGTTASVAFIRRQKIYIGHVGDSGIVLGYEDQGGGEWHGEPLTRDHKPESVVEKARITECGGKVINKSGVPRVVWNRPKSGHQGPVRRSTPMDEIPFLAVARSLGDLWSYNATNDQFVVSPEPDVYVMPIDISRHRCLIFGTDGLWNVLTPDAAVSVAHQAERNNEKHYLGVPNSSGKQRLWVNPSRSVVSGALGRYLKLNLRADNTSAVTVFLDPPGRPKREVLLQQKGMKKGSPVKPTIKTPEDALVQVHMYNQNQATKQEGTRSVLRIKECQPQKWQTSPQDDASRLALTPPECSDQGMTRLGCSECGYGSAHSVPSTSGTGPQIFVVRVQTQGWLLLFQMILDQSDTRRAMKPLRNDIQIPVISSSTISPGNKLSGKVKGLPTVAPQEKGEARRRTRSNVHQTGHVAESENMEQNPRPPNNNNEWTDQHGEEKAGTSSKGRNAKGSTTLLSANRVLKSVNRGTPEVVSRTSAKTVIASKRKRNSDLEAVPVGEPMSKSARVHTRSHTWSYKSMITRSQEKTHNTPTRTFTPHKK
ncbi:uncharacterized protein LOC123517733 [Portunus trituberculatus]|uniref:uncharacterized protein LOC123517733 n=1 Tax=Portunus trituberculatus TaxID=210409 RepID=UPI001E1CD4FD|nr:uncharacterized protein LOC123517733 [Portunus trituberculatus]